MAASRKRKISISKELLTWGLATKRTVFQMLWLMLKTFTYHAKAFQMNVVGRILKKEFQCT